MPVDPFWRDAALIFALILLNGFFSGAEIAVVSSRRSRLQKLEREGRRGAGIVARWLKEPEPFLAAVQIGVTFVGVMSSAVGGAAAIRHLEPVIKRVPSAARWAEPLSLAAVVVAISLLSLVLGELVPKSLGLRFREGMACRVAPLIQLLAAAARPLVRLLTFSTRLVLRLFGLKDIPREMFATEDEIRFLISEGAEQGVFDQTERQMIPKVFDFAETQVKALMVPREKVVALPLSTPKERLMTKVSEEGFTRVPVYDGTLDKVVGILHMKDLIHVLTMGQVVVLQDLIRPPVFVPETFAAKDLLLLFQKRRFHMAVVQDAGGRTAGVVTLEDLIEKIVGDIKDEHDVA